MSDLDFAIPSKGLRFSQAFYYALWQRLMAKIRLEIDLVMIYMVERIKHLKWENTAFEILC